MPWNPSQWDEFIDTAGVYAPPVDLAVPPLDQGPPPPMQLAVPDFGAPVPTDAQQAAAPEMPVTDPSAVTAAPAQPELLTPPLPDQAPASFNSLPSSNPPPPYQPPTGADFTIGQENDFGGVTPTDPDRMTPEQLGMHLSSLPPEQQEMERAKIEGAKHRFASARALDASEKAMRAAEDSARVYQDSVKAAQQRSLELDAEAKKLADENPLDSISGSRKVFGVLASIVGGFMMNKTGRNLGLEVVDSIANEAAAQHAAKLQLNARQQAGIGDQFSRAGDVYKAAETVRLATYDGAIKMLEAEVQNFDPRGTTALRVMDNIDAIKARRAEMLQKYAIEQQKQIESALKLQLDVTKSVQEQQKIDETARNNKAQIGLGYSQLARQKAKDATDFDLENKKLSLEADKLRAAGDEKGAKQLLEQGVAAPPALSVAPDGSVAVDKNTGVLKNADDKPWIIPTVEEAKAFRKKKAAADSIVSILDQIREIRRDVGGESSWGNSDAYQKLQVLKNNLTILKKSGTEGMSSDEDMKKIDAALGAKDPTSFRAMAAGLKEGRDQTIAQLNTDARSLGYTGKDITYADPLELRGGKSPEQEQVEQILKFDPIHTGLDIGGELGMDPTRFPGTSSAYVRAVRDELEKQGGVPPSIRTQIDALKATAASDPDAKKRSIAVEALEKIATSAEDKNVRAYALANAAPTPATSPEETE